MKFNIESKELSQQLNAVGRIILAKSPLSILENFLFTIEDNTLTITGSDQENVMTARIPITNVEGSGSIVLPAKRMIEMMKEMPEQGLLFAINDSTNEVTLKFNNGEFQFVGYNGNEYPSKEKKENTGEDIHTIIIPAKVINSGLANTAYAASSETIRPIMTGTCMDFKPESLIFVASDTHKLVKYEDSNVKPGIQRTIVLPPKASAILRNLTEKTEDDITITLEGNGATFETGKWSLSCVFITGVYPPYERVIPVNNPYTLECDRAIMLSAMRRMLLTTNAGSKLVRFNIQPEEILLSARDADYASSGFERVPITYSGNPMNLGFNCQYVVEVLANINEADIKIKLSDPSRPGIFMPAKQPEGIELIVLLMTMQLLD